MKDTEESESKDKAWSPALFIMRVRHLVEKVVTSFLINHSLTKDPPI